jgi:chemotaxis methyl-accepting protein methylase
MAFTFFFRDLPVIEYAVEHAVHFASGRMRFKVWDAGSAMGQETYTIAIVLAEKMGKFAFKNLWRCSEKRSLSLRRAKANAARILCEIFRACG